jgi:hypothetical protein
MIPEPFQDIIRAFGLFIFYYPVKKVFRMYLNKIKSTSETESLIKYHFPTLYKLYTDKFKNNKKNT